ncbi:MAG: methionyl-tRNA formyltransferase [Muribaculum sp.]|nr:methionyl-tRNA formyltransferase [Muribaculum sp.]
MKKEDLRIVFLGTPEFAVESLDRIVSEGYNVVGVVTMPDKPAGRGHKMLHSPVKQYAEARGLNLLQPVNLKDPEFLSDLRSLNANLFVVIAFRMLPRDVWQMPELGTFNLHASLLPRYRGAAPINWAVINGDKETGVTTFFLKHEIDTGDIIDQERIEIGNDDCVGDVHDRLMHLGAELTVKTIHNIIDGTLTRTPQSELLGGEDPTPAPKIFKDTCRIDWSQPAEKIRNLVRGLSPYPAAWTNFVADGKEPLSVKIFAVGVGEIIEDIAPGTIRNDSKILEIAAGDRWVRINSLQLAGKRRMNADEFLRGFDVSPYKAD